MTRRALPSICAALALGLWAGPARADLPEWLRKHNGDVDSGNEALNKGDAKGALESYTRAARTLPDAPGLQLDRGIALLKQGEYAKARESLLSATVPNASSDVRADAYHNLALSFYREADGLAGQNQHGDAQKLFREAVDSAKRSLHLRPSDPNTAWNLELSARRMREEEQKKKEEDEQKEKDKQDKDKQNQDQQNQDQQNQDQKQDQQDPDQQKQDDQQNQKQDDQQKPEQEKEKEKDQQDQQQNQPKPDQNEPQEQAPEQALPREAEQALDSLENNEENFERYRARQRANRERRAPEKDW
ncbi:MAG TPA: tetratricopeptide repeat protein [Polyangiales bacterium]|nr:tetratricopeptide repeat protein [Polyangiales bacterium]